MSTQVHLVLSSGGVRTLAYVGALQAMERADINVATVSAVSAGAVLGALIADGKTGDELAALVESRDGDLGALAGRQPGWPARLWALRKWPYAPKAEPRFAEFVVSSLGADKTFVELPRPFATMGIDVMAGDYLVYTQETHPDMRVSEAVRIATALPLMARPYQKGKRIVIDAAVSTRSPVWLTAAVEDERTANLPIVVLRPAPSSPVRAPKYILGFARRLIDATANGRDLLLLRGNPRVHTIDLPTAGVKPYQFDLDAAGRMRLVDIGRQKAAERIDAVDGNFASIQPHISSAAARLPGGMLAEHAAEDEEIAAWAGSHFAQQFHTSSPPEVFISYTREDFTTLADLLPHLARHAQLASSFSSWTDAEIRPGEHWEDQIRDAIARARAALVLVSPHLLASEFVRQHEWPQMVRAEQERRIPIIPLFVDRVEHADLEWSGIGERQGVNKPDRPLSEVPKAEREQELVRIVAEIARRLARA